MRRRQFLTLTTGGFGLLAGCQSDSESATKTATETEAGSPTASASQTPTEPDRKTETPTETPTDTPREQPNTIVVDPAGSDDNPGTSAEPVGSIQEALDRAEPGTTISLRAGVHTNGDPERPVGITRRGGKPDAPIRITGPPEAVVRGPPIELSSKPVFHIVHSHVHLDGMTLTGLTKPSEAHTHRWYRNKLVNCSPPTWENSYPDYLTGVTIKPSAVGGARGKLISAYRTNDLEIGEFEVIGPAGIDWFVGDKRGYALGAIVSLGRSSNNFGTASYPWEGPDESHDIHVHHIANRDGYQHTELVKLHSGNHDVTVEYCTDTGGLTRSGIHMPGAQSTVRWSVLTESPRNGVSVYVPPMKERGSYEAFSTIPDERFPGRNNEIYGNKLLDNGEGAIGFSSPEWFENSQGDQLTICGNTTDDGIDRTCPESVPQSDKIGYTGGDSPWV